MSDIANPPPASGEPKPKWWETPFWKKFQQWTTGILGVIIAVLGAVKLYHTFVPALPSCAASETGDVIRKIFKDKKLDLTKLNDMKTVTSAATEEDCQANIETADETATIDYHVNLQGREFLVKITKVDAHRR